MANRIRLSLIDASVKGTWSARSYLPALTVGDNFELASVYTTIPQDTALRRMIYYVTSHNRWRSRGLRHVLQQR